MSELPGGSNSSGTDWYTWLFPCVLFILQAIISSISDTLLDGNQYKLVYAVDVIVHFLLKHSRDGITLGLFFMSINNVHMH